MDSKGPKQVIWDRWRGSSPLSDSDVSPEFSQLRDAKVTLGVGGGH